MTSTDKSAAEREAFEAWGRSQNWFCSSNSFGEYTYETERAGWEAWQARASLTTPSKEPAGAVAVELRLVRSILRGYPQSFARADALRAVDKAEAALASHPEAPPASAPAAEVARLMRFYAVDSIDALIAAQAEHIEKLQSKLPQAPSFAPQRVREG